MSNQQNPPAEGSQDPPAPAANPDTTPTPATEPQASATPDPNATPDWLPDRLKQAKEAAQRKLLESLGASDVNEITAKLKKLDELETAQLSERERAEKLIQDLKPKADRAAVLEARLTEVVESTLAQAEESVRESIVEMAGDSAEERWKLIRAFQKAGKLNTPQAGAAPAPKPASTQPKGTPPAPTPPNTVKSEWDQIKYDKGLDPQVGATSVKGALHYMFNAHEIGNETGDG